MKFLFIILTLIAFLTGCSGANIHNNAEVGKVSSQADVAKVIQTGMTMEQVKAKLGEPGATRVFNNQTIWVYGHKQYAINSAAKALSAFITRDIPSNIKMVSIFFDVSGLVTNVQYSQQSG